MKLRNRSLHGQLVGGVTIKSQSRHVSDTFKTCSKQIPDRSRHGPDTVQIPSGHHPDIVQMSRHRPDIVQTSSRHIQTYFREVQKLSIHILCSRHSQDNIQTPSRHSPDNVQTWSRHHQYSMWTLSGHHQNTFRTHFINFSWHPPGNQFWIPGLFWVTNFGSQVCSG